MLLKKPIKNIDKSFQRAELEESLLIIPNGYSYNEALIINYLGKLVLSLCDGNRTIGEIIEIISKKEINKWSDKHIIDFVDQLSKLGLVKFEGTENMYEGKLVKNFNNYSIFRCGEGSFKRIQTIIQTKHVLTVFNSTVRKDDYNPLNLRLRLFNYLEEFYILENHEGDVSLFSIISGRIQPNKTASFGILLTTEELSNNELITFINSCINNFMSEIEPDCRRIRMSHLGNLTKNIQNLFVKAGFGKIQILKEEFGEKKDQYILDYNKNGGDNNARITQNQSSF